MCVQRIGLHFDFVKSKRNTHAFADHGYPLVIAFAARAKLARDVLSTRDTLGRQIRIQLKRQPAHGQLDIGLELGKLAERSG